MANRKLGFIGQKVKPISTTKVQPPPKQTESIYSTPEFRAWRGRVIARANGRCQDPQHQGSHGGGRLYADHIKELKDGGAPFDDSNGMARCASCHTRKTVNSRLARHAGR
jgi:hypothetical protein